MNSAVIPKDTTSKENVENLREALLDLERSKRIEQEIRIESEYLLTCLNALARIGLDSNALPVLLKTLQPAFEYDKALVLVQDPHNQGLLTVAASTHPVLEQSQWSTDWFSEKVTLSKPVVAFNIANISIWQQQDEVIRKGVCSALHVALRPLPKPAYLICTHPQIGFFGHKHSRRAIRFAPMAAQALLNIESTTELSNINQQLQEEVEERRKAQQALVQVQEKLIATARQAGKAEIATNVVHNIGNVLNSVNIGSEELLKQLNGMPLKYLRRMAEMIAENEVLLDSHEKMKLLPSVINKLTTTLEQKHQACCHELDTIQSHVEHISNIVKFQQQSAGYQEILDTVDLAKIMDAALSINFEKHEEGSVKIVKHYSSISCLIDKHKLLQILVNLISNAKQAVAQNPIGKRTIELSITPIGDEFTLKVIDNGQGIEKTALGKIFNHGYTTRSEGHGFGLHASALNASQLGGTLVAHSLGRHHGAEFTLTIPAK